MDNKNIINAPVKWMVTIVERGQGQKVAQVFQEYQINIHLVTLGIGTVKSDILDYIGLGGPEKDILMSLVPSDQVNVLIQAMNQRLHFSQPGKGIIFTLPLSCITAAVLNQFYGGDLMQSAKDVAPKENPGFYDLVVTVLKTGIYPTVMEAARQAGAGGGTLVKARSVGANETEKFLNITLNPEKEILFLLVPKSQRHTVMQAICNSVLIETGERATVFSLPIDEVFGLRQQEQQ